MKIEEIHEDKRVDQFFVERWGSEFIVSGDERLYGHDLDGFALFEDDEIVGLLTYHIKDDQCEIVTLDSLRERQGAGTMMIEKVIEMAKSMNVKRLWLMTTNDNIEAQEFYKKRGFMVSAINKGAIQKSRDLGQDIPKFGKSGIPVDDEIELEYRFK